MYYLAFNGVNASHVNDCFWHASIIKTQTLPRVFQQLSIAKN